jgi:hypothetical protein
MVMKTFNINDFPRFLDEWILYPDFSSYHHAAADYMRQVGFKSARFVNIEVGWGLSDEEYTWFLIRYS